MSRWSENETARVAADKEWRRRKQAQKDHDRAANNSFGLFNGGDTQGPLSIHPMGRFGIWPNGMSDGPVDFTWDPVDLFGNQKR